MSSSAQKLVMAPVAGALLLLGALACSSTDFGSAGASKGSDEKGKPKAKPEAAADLEDQGDSTDPKDPQDGGGEEEQTGTEDEDPLEEDGEVCSKPDETNFEEVVKNVYPAMMDAASLDAGDGSGKPPQQVFVGKKLVAGKKILLVSATGRAVFRIYHGVIEEETDCGHGAWRLDFRDATQKILQIAVSSIFDAQNQVFLVPEGAASAWVGFKDQPGTYFDNEGGQRTINAGPTGGCTFHFKILPPKCG